MKEENWNKMRKSSQTTPFCIFSIKGISKNNIWLPIKQYFLVEMFSGKKKNLTNPTDSTYLHSPPPTFPIMKSIEVFLLTLLSSGSDPRSSHLCSTLPFQLLFRTSCVWVAHTFLLTRFQPEHLTLLFVLFPCCLKKDLVKNWSNGLLPKVSKYFLNEHNLAYKMLCRTWNFVISSMPYERISTQLLMWYLPKEKNFVFLLVRSQTHKTINWEC